MSYMLEQALKRPRNFGSLSSSEQWAIDKRLGILDWDPDKAESAEFVRRWQAGDTPAEVPVHELPAKALHDEAWTLFIKLWDQAKASPEYDKAIPNRLDQVLQRLR